MCSTPNSEDPNRAALHIQICPEMLEGPSSKWFLCIVYHDQFMGKDEKDGALWLYGSPILTLAAINDR